MADLLPITQIGSIVGVVLAVATTIITRTVPWLRSKIASHRVSQGLGTLFTEGQLERTIRYYIEPMCQDIDPAGAEEPRLVFGVRQRLFNALDEVLSHPTEFRYIFLLADSGMGKSSALINYYARNLRRLRSRLQIELVPLGIPNADDLIAAIPERHNKILFLDAFDEDTLAIVDHAERLRNLINATKGFQRVLITCRTQFFGKEEEIPIRTGILKVGARGAGESAEYFFHKMYISPFGESEIQRYLRKRYPVWHSKLRRRASRMVARVPNLAVRPMLLAHVDDLVSQNREAQSSVELYEEMTEAWLSREEGFIQNKADLRRFSESLAVDIFLNRSQRGAERVAKSEIERFAKDWEIPIESWALTGRSLLNRDTEGNYKFAHRSIMEFFFLKALSQGDRRCIEVPWTDQMREFFLEGLTNNKPWALAILLGAKRLKTTNLIEACFTDPEEQLFPFLRRLAKAFEISIVGVARTSGKVISYTLSSYGSTRSRDFPYGGAIPGSELKILTEDLQILNVYGSTVSLHKAKYFVMTGTSIRGKKEAKGIDIVQNLFGFGLTYME